MLDEPPFDEAAEPERLQRFIDEIEAGGFTKVDATSWEGPIRQSLVDAGHTEADRMTLIIRPSWPYFPPLLHVPGISAWHADQQRLCIWHGEDNSQRWTTLAGIHDRIDEWVEQARVGFAAVENARNPEIYWQEECEIAAGLVDLEELIGRDRADGQHDEFHFGDARSADGRSSPITVFDLERGAFRSTSVLPDGVSNHRLVRGRWFYRASIPHPPRSVEELRSFLTDTQRDRLDRDLRARPFVMFGLVWPNNAGLVATMILSRADPTGARANALIVLRPKGPTALLLRAGPDAEVLQAKSVAILGVGAIGSHVADQLARAGLGRLQLIDYDRLWPPNLIRHAAPPGTPAGTLKTDALRHHLSQYPWVKVDAVEGSAWTPSALRHILESADLVIEATGHGGLAELTGRVAEAAGRPVISVALFRGGGIARVRRQALPGDTPLVRRRHLDRYPEILPLDDEVEYAGTETGCLAFVHNAPPVAVTRAANLAAEAATDLLAGRADHDDEIVEVLRPGDPPFNHVGRVRRDDLPATVDLTESSDAELRRLAQNALPRETGGVLLGCIIDERPVVSHVVEIVDAAATATSFRIAEGAVPDAVEAARADDPRVGYLGEWHSHIASAGPSPTDIAAMIAVAETGDAGDEPVLLVVHPDGGAKCHLDAYVTRNGRVIAAALCPTGELPDPAEPTP